MTPDSILSYIKKRIKPEHKTAFFSALIIGLLAHMYAMTNNFLTYDSMWNLYSDQDMITSGRQFLTYACSLGSYYDLPFVNGLLAIFWLALASVVIVEAFRIKGFIFPILVSGLIVTFPTVSSTFAYTYTIDGYMLSVLLAALAFLFSDRKKYGCIAGIFFLGTSIGIYQAQFSLTILMCVFVLLLYILNGIELRELGVKVLRYLIMGIGGYAFYLVSLKIMLALKHTEISGYQGTDRVSTFSLSELPEGLKAAWDNFTYFLRYGGAFSTTFLMKICFLLLILMGGIAFIYIFLVNRIYKKPLYILFTLILFGTVPFASCLIKILSPDTTFHLLMRMPWVIILVFMVALNSLLINEVRPGGNTASYICVIASAMLVLQFAVAGNIAYFNLNARYEKTYALAVRLEDRIEQAAGYYPGMPVSILGGFPDSEYYPSTDITRNDLSGYFGVDGDYVCNSSGSFNTFMSHYLGFSFETLTLEEELKLAETEEFKTMTNFPTAESIKIINGVMVVKFNG